MRIREFVVGDFTVPFTAVDLLIESKVGSAAEK